MNYTKIEQAKKYIEEHCYSIKTVKDIADHVGLNSEYLTRAFRQVYRHTLKKYLDTVRLYRALELLRTTDHKCYSIAQIVGLKNERDLCMLFKRMGYKSPRHYRAVNHPPPDEEEKKSEKVNRK